MSLTRRILGIARHGFTPVGEDGMSLDSLTDESVQRMAGQGLDPDIFGHGTKSDRAFVLHSEKDRTLTTAKARLAGIRGMTPKPMSQGDLEGLSFDEVDFYEDARLSYENLKLNMNAVKEMGLPKYTDWILANRNAVEIQGEQITSFQHVYDTRRPVLGDAVRRLEAGNFDLGFISTHGVMTDAIAIAAVDSARSKGNRVREYSEIGGQFGKEDTAYVIVDSEDKSGKSNARIVRGELELPVNIDRIRSEY